MTPRITTAQVQYIRSLLHKQVSHRDIKTGHDRKFKTGVSLKTISKIKQDPGFTGVDNSDLEGELPSEPQNTEELEMLKAIADQFDRLFLAINQEIRAKKMLSPKDFITLVKANLNLAQIDQYKKGKQ
jgi:hypothetical protein